MVQTSFAAATALSLLVGSAGLSSSDMVKAALRDRLPKTRISAVECSRIEGLCEVIAGDNLFYVDKSARYLVIGRIYDMQTRQDLTAARLLELNPDMLVGGAAKANAVADAADKVPPGNRAELAISRKLDLSGLSDKGAIVWGSGPQSVTVFSDFHCGYCRALSAALETMNVRVIERPISVLGSRDIADQVLCARDRHRALRAAYAQEPVAGGRASATPAVSMRTRRSPARTVSAARPSSSARMARSSKGSGRRRRSSSG